MLRTGLIIALIVALGFLGVILAPRFGGRYWLHQSDHADAMTSGTSPATTRHIGILFLGNSFTYNNDLPAMLVNLAAADGGNTTELTVKAFTVADARLGALLRQTDALAWARAHHVDFAVLQEHSDWYELPDWIEDARKSATAWRDAVAQLHTTPVLFESWADQAGSDIYTDPRYFAFGKTPAEVARDSEIGTAEMAQDLGIPMVLVGGAFNRASGLPGAPNLYESDRHHPSIAGTYLAALTFYRYFTGRSGAESHYRPWGLSADEAALLVKAAGE